MEVAELVAVLRADTADFDRKMRDGEQSVKDFSRNSSTSLSDFKRNAMTALAGFGIATLIKDMTNAAIDFDSAFADVRKTIDGTDQELSDLQSTIRDMARSSDNPLSALENSAETLMGIAALGGQLGVATEDIDDFSQVVGEMTVATNLGGEEAAMFFARFQNITGLPTDELRNLGDTIVTLGNNMAAQESEITAFANRLAPLSTFDVPAEDILALAAAAASLGLTAELGGTNITKTFQDIIDAVAKDDGKLESFADAAGMAADEFAELAKSDPSEAFDSLIEGLSEMSGDEALQTLDDLGIKGQEQVRTLLTLAGGYETVEKASKLATEAMNGNNALMDEANNKADTTAGRINRIQNNVTELAAQFGEAILPLIDSITTGLADLFDDVSIGDGLQAWVDNFKRIPEVFTFIFDDIKRGFDIWALDLQMRVIDFIAGFRQTILDATGGRVDIAPDINFATADIASRLANMNLADTLTQEINNDLQNSGGIDLSDAFTVTEDGFSVSLMSQLQTAMATEEGIQALADSMGERGKAAIQQALTNAFMSGDTETLQLLTPLGLELELDEGITMENLRENLAQIMEIFADDPQSLDLAVEIGIVSDDAAEAVRKMMEGQTFFSKISVAVDAAISSLNLSGGMQGVAGIVGTGLNLAKNLGIPGFHTGGEFYHPRGEGLAFLQSGEVILTPQQLAGSRRGGGDTYMVNSYGQSPQELLGLIQRAKSDAGY